MFDSVNEQNERYPKTPMDRLTSRVHAVEITMIDRTRSGVLSRMSPTIETNCTSNVK